MSRLNTKLWRELERSKWQFIAVAVTVTLGIGFFHGSLSSYGNLGKSYDLTYRTLAFGDVWVRMTAAPDTLVRRVGRLPGVRVAMGRIVQEARVRLRGRQVHEVMGRLISLPAEHQPDVNRVRVTAGRYFRPQGGREVLLEASFAKGHNLRPGDFIYPTIQGQEIRFRIVGLVQTPEYIYSIQSKQYLVPTPDTFGVMFIPQHEAELLLDVGGEINELCLITDPGKRDAVARLVRPLTDRYGGEEPVTRDEQPSNKLLMADLNGYRQMAVILPLLFLTGTVLTSYTLLARLAQSQAVQIGVLRAMGCGQRAVLTHYLWLAAAPAAVGGVFGVGLGYLFAWSITRLYVELINIPYMFFETRPWLILAAFVIAVAAGLVGALAPARSAARLPPAQAVSQQAAMTDRMPAAFRWVGAGLPMSLKLPLRNLMRRPTRAVYTVLGVILGVCLMVLSFALLDAVDYAISTYFREIERYDLSVSFAPEQAGRVITQISSWPGVTRAEPTLDVPIEVERRGVTYPTVLIGLPTDSRLRRLTTQAGARARPEPGQALVGRLIADRFNVSEGDLLTIKYAQNRREFKIVRTARVGPAITQPIGSAVYMGMGEVRKLFGERLGIPRLAVSGALVKAEPQRLDWVRQRLDRMPTVAAVQTREQSHQQIEDLMRFSRVFTGILAFFGVGLAFAVVFTSVSISVLERLRELATLRTLGYSMRQIASFITIENLLLSAVGIGVGLPIGRWLDVYLMTASQTESVTLEPVIFTRTYLIALGAIVALTLLAQIPSFVSLRRMNLATATKEIAA